jgi:hypothetical protein
MWLRANAVLTNEQNSPQLDEAVWQAWLNKNKAQDRFRYDRRFRAIALIAVLLTVSVLLWKFMG